MSDPVKYTLEENEIPRFQYNLAADLPTATPPVLHPGTMQPIGPVRDVLKQWRPSPLYRARRFEKELRTPARIYYKYESDSPAGWPTWITTQAN
jgi:tryptophan synthase beta chain